MKLIAPNTGTFTVEDGTAFIPTSDGTLDVSVVYAEQLITMGWQQAPDDASDTTTNRPATGLSVGLQWYDVTLQKPIWWSGSQWKDAAGTAV